MKTFMARPETVEMKWYLVDATNKPLGRLASQVAAILQGKNDPTYTKHVGSGNHVIIVNTDKVVLTGKKLDNKTYRRHTGQPGGLKETTYRVLMQTRSDLAVTVAIKGMLPRNSLGKDMLTNIRVYKGAEHEQTAQQPVVVELV